MFQMVPEEEKQYASENPTMLTGNVRLFKAGVAVDVILDDGIDDEAETAEDRAQS